MNKGVEGPGAGGCNRPPIAVSEKELRVAMLFIYNESTDPYYNLACEEYLIKNSNEDIFMLWRNDNTIVVGKNQNTLGEINLDYVEQHGIRVVRRLSGGGAVFHDLGNINFTFIENGGSAFSDYARFTKPIIDFLRSLGIDAGLKGRNDLVIGEQKISGNAQYLYRDRILHHGTLLYSAEQSRLADALKVSEDKIQSKGIRSVRSRVTNISDHLGQPMPVEMFLAKLMEFMTKNNPEYKSYNLDSVKQEIETLAEEKYRTWEWNFGYSPKYTYTKKKRYACGGVEVQLNVMDDGIIEAAKIYGDFFSEYPVSELESMLCGKQHHKQLLGEFLKTVDVGRYISGINGEEFLQLLF